jgi:hypothetical protein
MNFATARGSSNRSRCLYGIVFLLAVIALSLSAPQVNAQTIEDGIMMNKKNLFTGPQYAYSYWNEYWEGTRQRTNGNIGTVITQSVDWYGNYGVTDKINVIASFPYIWSHTTQGVLHDQKGFQDVTLAGKWNFYNHSSAKYGDFRAIAVVAGSIPMGSYYPDYLPLSIGCGCKTISTRLTLNYRSTPGWFINGSAAYTWRSDVTLDRPYYFTENQLFLTNQVNMPNVFSGFASAGYLKHGLMAQAQFARQNMQGGGDIRRQDMPFVSNRMNYSTVGGMVMYALPFLDPRRLAFKFQFDYTVDGRNVGHAKTFTTGLLYTLNFSGKKNIQ